MGGLAWMHLIAGTILVGIALSGARWNGGSVVVVLAAIVIFVWGLGNVRSKVLVDAEGLHIRTAFRWRHVGWKDSVSFLVESTTEYRLRFHRVVILVPKGRPISPFALVFGEPEDAIAVLGRIDEFRVRASLR